jgi:hypothetical protein
MRRASAPQVERQLCERHAIIGERLGPTKRFLVELGDAPAGCGAVEP